LAGITRAIPVIGPVVSGIPICILAALQSVNLGVGMLVFMVIMHFVESKFIMPILIGDRMKLHPAVILIVLLIGAELFGLLGMFLAAPIAAVVREMIYFYVIRPRRENKNGKQLIREMVTSTARSER
jgi:predicted PurR-regulated permease PerM